jgi:hypothetical protein
MAENNSTAKTTEAEANAKQKHRSPSYPAFGLERALQLATRIHAAEGVSPTKAEIAVKHIGYSSMSGVARVALSTIKKFGLLVEEGATVRISESARRYILQPDQTERAKLAREFALKPEIVREFLTTYKGSLPSDETLIYTLQVDRNFGQDAAKTFVQALRETIRFANLGQDEYSADVEAQPETDVKAADLPPPAGVVRRSVLPPSSSPGIRFELSDGTWVELQTSSPLTADTMEELNDYLKVYAKILAKKKAQQPAEDAS